MFDSKVDSESATFYSDLERELTGIISGEPNLIANLANIASLIYHAYPRLNWCGFYLWVENDKELVLGPFQGKPACIRIRPERGVCGASYKQAKTMKVDDVHAFSGHIACDAATESELVVPLIKNGIVYGVLDMDSPEKSRFSNNDAEEFTRIMNLISPIIFEEGK